jgi:hypothetical protein
MLQISQGSSDCWYVVKSQALFGACCALQEMFGLPCRVVAASNTRKYDDTFVPLQDNVALAAKSLMSRSGLLSHIFQWHWAHIGNFLFCFLALPFSVLWDQV